MKKSRRFAVWFITNGGDCCKLFVDEKGKVTERWGESIHPYDVTCGSICPHCTSKANWTRYRAIAGKPKRSTAKRPRVTVVPNPMKSRLPSPYMRKRRKVA